MSNRIMQKILIYFSLCFTIFLMSFFPALANENGEASSFETLGYTEVNLDGETNFVRTQDTNLGNLAADAIKEYTGAELSILQGGSIRSSIKKGAITESDISIAFPFENYICLAKIQGKDLVKVLENSVSVYPDPSGRFLQVSGISFTFYSLESPGNRIKSIFINDTPIDLERYYTMAANDYLITGGDGYDMLSKCEIIKLYPAIIAEAVKSYINSKEIDPVQILPGRIISIATFRAPVIPGKIEAEDFVSSQKIRIVEKWNRGFVSNIRDSSLLRYHLDIQQPGIYHWSLNVSSRYYNSKIIIRDQKNNILAIEEIPYTGEDNWELVELDLPLSNEMTQISLHGTSGEFNLDWIEIKLKK